MTYVLLTQLVDVSLIEKFSGSNPLWDIRRFLWIVVYQDL